MMVEEPITHFSTEESMILDLSEITDSILDDSLELAIEREEFNELQENLSRMQSIIRSNHFTSIVTKEKFMRTLETFIDALQNPLDYKLNNTYSANLLLEFLNDMLTNIHISNETVVLSAEQNRNLYNKWYKMALLLRSHELLDHHYVMVAFLAYKDVTETTKFIINNRYSLTINETEKRLYHDDTAERRRYQRHIYFRNLNARRKGTAGRKPAIR